MCRSAEARLRRAHRCLVSKRSTRLRRRRAAELDIPRPRLLPAAGRRAHAARTRDRRSKTAPSTLESGGIRVVAPDVRGWTPRRAALVVGGLQAALVVGGLQAADRRAKARRLRTKSPPATY